MSDTPKLKVYAALVTAQRTARAVFKDGKNDFHRYKYATAESIIDEGRAALTSAGLTFFVSHVEILPRSLPRFVVSKGDRSEQGPGEVLVSTRLVLAHESGEALEWIREWPAVEEKGRPLDKAVAGALTNGLAYALRDLLLLPRDDDAASMDRRDDRPEPPKKVVDQAYEEKPKEREDEAPASHARPVPPAPESGTQLAADSYEGILAALERGEVEYMASRIARAAVPDDTKRLLTFVVRAYEAHDKAEFAKVGAEVRSSGMPKPWVDETIARMRPAWDRLHKGAA
jgi:hypothetical protein